MYMRSHPQNQQTQALRWTSVRLRLPVREGELVVEGVVLPNITLRGCLSFKRGGRGRPGQTDWKHEGLGSAWWLPNPSVSTYTP